MKCVSYVRACLDALTLESIQPPMFPNTTSLQLSTHDNNPRQASHNQILEPFRPTLTGELLTIHSEKPAYFAQHLRHENQSYPHSKIHVVRR